MHLDRVEVDHDHQQGAPAIAVTTVPDSHPRLGRAIREAAWIVLAAAGIYLALILASYSRTDPGPSFSGSGAPLVNKGGAIGAWLADAFYYVFGMSAWWWVLLAVYCILRMYRRVDAWEILSRRTLAVSLTGFAVVLAASCTLEAMRLHGMFDGLGFAPGGALGAMLAHMTAPLLGFTGATVLLLAMIAGGLSLFTGLSWIRVAELTGGALEWAYAAFLN
ncbi:MAG TPA: DNA translocase FtsK 4TM domain-containing protein, partial [Usitatibacter sp.]|nr:DNA translocase FtsK 4TM domain-containing protein [Usitatibacter sp.]